ncbi:prepilin peptidase [Leucobacter sp. G161]|uniref:prepilin peptidase n=1 Tax=Leucobacter sp. G161 TaxID=663704 RepID=UPI00128EB888|nr:prepilin peptidase [Leucobacter sp. G161]
MARKSRPANLGADAAAVTGVDLIAAGIGAATAVLVAAWVLPAPAISGSGMLASWLLPVLGSAGFGAGALLLVRIDLRSHTLPNSLVFAATLCACGPLTLASVIAGEGWSALVPWAAAAAMTLIAFGLWASRTGMIGGGDVKLMPAACYVGVWHWGTGGWIGGMLAFAVLLAGMLAVGGLAAILRGRREFAAGPLLLAAAGSAAVLGALAGQ